MQIFRFIFGILGIVIIINQLATNPLIAMGLIVGLLLWYTLVMKKTKNATLPKKELAKPFSHKEYIERLESLRTTTFYGVICAISLYNLAKNVWENAVYQISNPDTDKYTKKGEYIFKDFNDVLNDLYNDRNIQEQVTCIRENQNDTAEIMRSLVNPPDNCFEGLAIARKLYEVYRNFTDLACCPTGSLISYSQLFKDYDRQFSLLYDKLGLYTPGNSKNMDYSEGDDGQLQTPVEKNEPDTNNNTSYTATTGQKNALKSAKIYLNVMTFSYERLIFQLEFEQYSHEDAVYAADNCGADWNEQAAKSAKNYLDIMPFSKDGLIDQLEFEDFTHEQAVYGAEANGY